MFWRNPVPLNQNFTSHDFGSGGWSWTKYHKSHKLISIHTLAVWPGLFPAKGRTAIDSSATPWRPTPLNKLLSAVWGPLRPNLSANIFSATWQIKSVMRRLIFTGCTMSVSVHYAPCKQSRRNQLGFRCPARWAAPRNAGTNKSKWPRRYWCLWYHFSLLSTQVCQVSGSSGYRQLRPSSVLEACFS